MIKFIKSIFEKIGSLVIALFKILFEDEQPVVQERKQPSYENWRARFVKPQAETPAEMLLESDEPPRYKKSKSVLTFQERKLARALRGAIADDYTLLMKVRMADFLWLTNEPKDKKFHNNQILCKHVDFLICGKLLLDPLLVIELDDKSHQALDRSERDKFKDDLFEAVGLPIIRVELGESYNIEQLRGEIKEKALEAQTHY
jgi:very-short-patch-repair endonuclease